MQTTVIRDSVVGDSWIAEMARLNPVSRIIGEDGKPNGNISTGPVRLAFCDALFTAKPKMKSDANSKVGFGATILFTPYADMAIFWEEYYRICAADFSSYYNPANQQYNVDNPLYDQGTKAQYGGFTTGCWATNASSNYKPPIVDMRMNPITDESKVYPGVWAIAALNPYASGKPNKPKKGPRFGLQTLMIIGDDTPLAGGAPDPRAQFKGVSVKPPVGMPAQAFGQNTQQPPGAPPANTYYPPGGHLPPQMPQGMAPPPGGGVPAYTPAYLPPPPPGNGDEDLSAFS